MVLPSGDPAPPLSKSHPTAPTSLNTIVDQPLPVPHKDAEVQVTGTDAQVPSPPSSSPLNPLLCFTPSPFQLM